MSLKRILLEKDHGGLQFLKYAFCGGFAFAADVAVFFLSAWLLFPALAEDELLVRLLRIRVETVPEAVRTFNFVACNVLAFLASNMVAYLLNVLFVFKTGRHGRWKEMGLFYLVSGASIAIGIAIGAVLVGVAGLSTSLSYLAKTVSATMVNYLARKFFIFRG